MNGPSDVAIARLAAYPGDVVLIHHGGRMSSQQRQTLQDHFKDLLPRNVKLAVLEEGMRISVLQSKLAIGAALPGHPAYLYAGIMHGAPGEADYYLAACVNAVTVKWGVYGRDLAGASSRRDGLTNTRAMADAGHEMARTLLEAGGYIASQAEAQLVAANLHEHMPKGWHWTSTQYSPSYAWVQGFEYGYSYFVRKDLEFRAVAVRRFNPSDFGPSNADVGTGAGVAA